MMMDHQVIRTFSSSSPLLFCVSARERKKVVLYASSVTSLLFGYLLFHNQVCWFVRLLKPRCVDIENFSLKDRKSVV